MHFQVSLLLDRLEWDEPDVELLKDKILLQTALFTAWIQILTSIKG
ncbi:MAG: hypothetical protein LBH43_14940 [Treponema sp.]|jgi:hypothetical protein|nr:hypothetical protein [Treponema sp.]